jgi:threonyl-tRNA synthetase
MIEITLPDGSKRPFEHPVSVQDVAASIGAGLAKATLAGKVDDKLVDAGFTIDHDAHLQIVTDKSPEALEILRHSTAHLMGQAVQRLFPGAQVTIGPVIENGFYYDFAYERPFTPEDLPKIEAEMHKIVDEQLPVTRSVKSRDDAITSSATWARNTRRRSSSRSRLTRSCRSIRRASSPTCAAARTCPTPASCVRSS